MSRRTYNSRPPARISTQFTKSLPTQSWETALRGGPMTPTSIHRRASLRPGDLMSPRSMRSVRSGGMATPRRASKTPRRANPHRQGTGGYLAAYKHKADMQRAKPVQSIAMVSTAMPGSGGTSSRRRQSTLMSPTAASRASHPLSWEPPPPPAFDTPTQAATPPAPTQTRTHPEAGPATPLRPRPVVPGGKPAATAQDRWARAAVTPLEPGNMGGAYRYRETTTAVAPPPPPAGSKLAHATQANDPKSAILRVFAAFDHTHTGRVAVEDFKRGLHYLGVSKHHTPDEVESWISKVDKRGEGVVDYITAVDSLAVKKPRPAPRREVVNGRPVTVSAPSAVPRTTTLRGGAAAGSSVPPAALAGAITDKPESPAAAGGVRPPPEYELFRGGRSHVHHPGAVPEQHDVYVPPASQLAGMLNLAPPPKVVDGNDDDGDGAGDSGDAHRRPFAMSGLSVTTGYTALSQRSSRSNTSRTLASGPFATNQHDAPQLSSAAQDYLVSLAVSETLDAHSRQAVKRVSQQCTAGRMQKTFRSLDTSGAGVLSKRQFKHALDLMGLHEDRDDYTTIWRLADARGTGRVNYEHFRRRLLYGAMSAKKGAHGRGQDGQTSKIGVLNEELAALARERVQTVREGRAPTAPLPTEGGDEVSDLASRLSKRIAGGGKRLWALCRQHDKPHNGTLRVQDFQAAMTTQLGLPLSANDVTLLTKHLDANGTGLVNYNMLTYLMKASEDADQSQPTHTTAAAGARPSWVTGSGGPIASPDTASANKAFGFAEFTCDGIGSEFDGHEQHHVLTVADLGCDEGALRRERMHQPHPGVGHSRLLSWDPADGPGTGGDDEYLKVLDSGGSVRALRPKKLMPFHRSDAHQMESVLRTRNSPQPAPRPEPAFATPVHALKSDAARELVEGRPMQDKSSAAEEAQALNRSSRRHPAPPRSSSPARASKATPPPHLNEDGVPTRVLRLRRSAPLPGGQGDGASRSQSARRARQERGGSYGGQAGGAARPEATSGPQAAGLRARPRSQSTLRGRPTRSVTFEDKVRAGRVPAGLRPQQRRHGKRLLDPHHQYHTVDRNGGSQAPVESWEMIVTAPAGVRTNTGPAFSLAHPE